MLMKVMQILSKNYRFAGATIPTTMGKVENSFHGLYSFNELAPLVKHFGPSILHEIVQWNSSCFNT